MKKLFLALCVALFSLIALPASASVPNGYTMTALAVDLASAVVADVVCVADVAGVSGVAVSAANSQEADERCCSGADAEPSYIETAVASTVVTHDPIDPGRSV